MSPVPRHLLPETSAERADGSLEIGGVSTLELAAQYGTPLFVYDEQHLRSRCREAVTSFGADRVVYATKAFLCRAMARLVHEEGLMLDVATSGELFVALSAGVPASRCVLHGNNKSLDELRFAITSGVHHINVDSFDELDRLDTLHREGLPVPRVALRITPGVEAHTHEYIATGQDDSKFGFNLANGDAAGAVSRADRSPSVELMGLHCHIGSNVFAVSSFARAAEVMAAFAAPYDLPELTLGGGLGVAYVEGEQAPSISEWATVLLDACRSLGVRSAITVEPGRSIVANAAVTLYSVGTIKDIPGVRSYLSVDGGMSDNPRPVLYGSGYEAFLPRAWGADRVRAVRVVGKHCESGDILINDAMVPADTAVGDVLAMPVTGAYGYSMSSNYNMVGKPAVVFVRDGKSRLVLRRQTHEDLVALDID
jgi:diaminopimelate decarboxylase